MHNIIFMVEGVYRTDIKFGLYRPSLGWELNSETLVLLVFVCGIYSYTVYYITLATFGES